MVYAPPKSYEFFYEGTYSQLEPTYGPLFLGYRVPFSSLQLHTNPQTANIVAEASDRLSQGVKGVMVNVLDPRTFENIPRQLFEEVKQLHKLVGAEPSMHAPLIDPAGFGGRGEWSQTSREEAETHLKSVMERAHALDPSGNMPVTVHASMMPSVEWWKKAPVREGEEGKSMIYAVNTETKQIAPLPYEEKFYPGPEKRPEEMPEKEFVAPGVTKEIHTPEKSLAILNNTTWHNRIVEIQNEKIHADRILQDIAGTVAPVLMELNKLNEQEREDFYKKLTPEQHQALAQFNTIKPLYEDVGVRITSAFNDSYSYYAEQYERETEESKRKNYKDILKLLRNLGKEIHEAQTAVAHNDLISAHNKFTKTLHDLSTLQPPRIYKPVEEFALPHTSETIANVALHAFKKYGSKAPVIALENVYPNMAFSRAESLKKLVEESRKKFIEKATEEGYSYDKAVSMANRLIGATWDVGHIFQLKKHGYSKEDIIKETGKIAPFVKFVHLTDNFGFEDSHLPPGMGEVPFKELLKELEKAGKLKHAIEAGGLLNLGKEAGRVILPATVEALGAPVYSYQPRGPFWNQLVYAQGGYSMGFGPIGTSQDIYSFMGFSTLPQELGGALPGRGGQRFAGAPME